ncbi:MAG: hypothetical protein QNJ16_11270 [Rhodobacter sp.]|nr:hypothetical protein [Rhodobacter sp.]
MQHLVDRDRVGVIQDRVESYIHIARRLVAEQFGPEAAQDQILVTVTLAATMANLETAEIIASSQDRITEVIERLEKDVSRLSKPE